LAEYKTVLSQMALVVSAPTDRFERLWFDTFNERGLGVFPSLEANVKYICDKLGVKVEEAHVKLAAKIDRDYTARAMVARPEASLVLSHLKSHGYKVGLITDCSAEIPELMKNLPFARIVDVAIFSSLAGMQKPDPRIYRLAADRLAVRPEACLYGGDGDSYELTGATGVGMHPVLVRDPSENQNDVHRVDSEREGWVGTTIGSLKEILPLLE